MEPQPAAPQPTNNYDFILNPPKPPKKKLFGSLGNDTFITKIIVLVGGTVALMIVGAVVVNVFFGDKTNVNTLVELAQTEQEIVRLSQEGSDATAQVIKNSAINTGMTVKSHQRGWLAFVKTKGREVKSEELGLKKDSTADKRLDTAKQTSTFDSTYLALMRSKLEDYGASIKSAYEGAVNKQERDMLNKQYDDVSLLLKQWPPAEAS